MSCIFKYKGQEFNTKKDLLDYFSDNKITKVDFKRDVTFTSNNKFTTVQQREITNTLALAAFKYAKGDISNFANKDFSILIEDYLTKQIKKMSSDYPLKGRWEEVLASSDFFANEVKGFFESKGISVVEELKEDNNGNPIIENALLVDPKMSATAKVRSLLSLVPSFTRNKKGNIVEDVNTFLGTSKFVEENVMWNDVKIALSDISDPSLDKMISALNEEKGGKPHLGRLASIIEGKSKNPITGESVFDERIRTQFFNAFSLSRIDYMSIIIEQLEGGIRVKTSTTDPSSQQKMLMDQWISNFNHDNTHLKGDSYFYDQTKISNILSEYNKVRKSIAKAISDTSRLSDNANSAPEDLVKSLKEDVIKSLRLAGIELTPSGLEYVLRPFRSKQISELKALRSFLTKYDGVRGVIDEISEINNKLKQEKLVPMTTGEGNPIKNNSKRILSIAKKQGEMISNLAETNSMGAEGNMYSNYGTHSITSRIINDLNSDFEKASSVINNEIYGNGSRIIDWMSKDPNNKLKYFVINNYKTIGTGDQGAKIGSLQEADALVAALNITLSDGKTATYTGLAEADKSRQVVVKGGEFLESGVKFNNERQALEEKYELLNNNVTDTLMGYFSNEVTRMISIYENMYGENKIPEQNRVKYLHSEENIMRSFLFPEFTKKGKNGKTILENLRLVETKVDADGKKRKVPKEFSLEFSNNRNLRKLMKVSFLKALESDIMLMEQNGIIERTEKGYKNIAIDSEILKSRYKGNVVSAIADFTLNSIAGSVETTKLFTGDPALYKVKEVDGQVKLFDDFKKRIPLMITGGTLARVYVDKNTGEQAVREYYNSAVTGNVELPSDYFTEKNSKGEYVPKKSLVDKMYKAVNDGSESKESVSRKALEEMISSYGEVNTTDAQAWITLDLFKERFLSYGKWSDEHESAFRRIKDESSKLLPSDVKMFAQPLKTVHVEVINQDGHGVRHYNKQSEAVIIPGLFPDLDRLTLNNPDVDHFITLDGKKVGASGVTPINEGGKLIDSKLPYVKLKTSFTYLQQDLPTKQVKNTLVGSQVVKNLLANLIKKGLYTVPSYEEVSGDEAIKLYHETISALSEFEKENLFQEFGYDPETGLSDDKKYEAFLLKSLKDELTNSEKEYLDSGLSIDSFPHLLEKLENKLMSAILKSTVKLKQLGSANIQMSAFGATDEQTKLSDSVKNGIIWFKKPSEGLKPMGLEEEKESKKLYTTKSQVLIPHSTIKKLLEKNYPDWKSMSSSEISGLIDPSVLTGISYRIPNQSTSSNDVFEIAGILPAEMGDTIISYNEITTKTGSDFDIDKAFTVLPNVEFRDGKITKPKYFHEMSEKEAYFEKTSKDWMNSVKAREEYRSIENELFTQDVTYKEIKDEAQYNIKLIKGKLAAEQEFRNQLPTIDDDVSEISIKDLLSVLKGTLDSMVDNFNESGKAIPTNLSKVEVAELKRDLSDQYEVLNTVNDEIDNIVKERLKEQGVIPTFEDYQAMPRMMKYTKVSLQNFRLDLMQGLLGDPKTYPAAVTALDNPLLEKEAKSVSGSSNEDLNNLHFFRGSTQVKTKVLFDQAKSLVGNIANNMADHNLSQSEEMSYTNTYFGKGPKLENESLLSAIKDTEGSYVSNSLNLYMNAIVDAAKDPYIVSANINQFTAPVAFMLIRSGVDIKWVNAFIAQRSLKSLVKGKNVDESKIAVRKYDKKGKLITPESKIIDFYEKKTGTKFQDIREDVFNKIGKVSTKDLKNNIVNPSKRNYDQEFLALAAFMEYKTKAKELNASIRASKADVSIGKNLLEAYIKELNLIKILDSKAIRNLHKKFGISEDKNVSNFDNSGHVNITEDKIAGVFHKNGIQTALKLWSGKTFKSSPAFRNALFKIALENNPKMVVNTKNLEILGREIYSYVASMEGSGITNGEIKDLFFGEKTLARELYSFNKRNKEFVAGNVLLQDIKTAFREKEDDPEFLLFRNKNQDRELYQQAWKSLGEYDPKLASKLFKYSYHASGFKKGSYSFYQHTPTEAFVNTGFSNFANDLNIAGNDPNFLLPAVKEIMSHLWDEKSIIQTASATDITQIEKGVKTSEAFFVKDPSLFSIGRNSEEREESARYLRNSKGSLFMLKGYAIPKDIKKSDSFDDEMRPLYVKITKKGYNDGGKVIKEYGIKSSKSIVKENNVSLSENALFSIDSYNIIEYEAAYTDMSEAIDRNISKSRKTATESEVNEAVKRCKQK